MSVHHAQRLAAGIGILAAIVLLTSTAQHVAFGHAKQSMLTTEGK